MGFVTFLLTVIAVIGGFVLTYVIFYNKLMEFKTKLEQAESIIDDSLRKKYDIFYDIDILVCGILDSKKSYLRDLDKIKNQNITNFDFDRKLVEYEVIFKQLKQDYEKVDNDKKVKALGRDLKELNERLDAAKIYFNKNTNSLNELVRKFPTNMIARIHGFDIRPFYDGKDMQDDIVDDFKV